MQAVFPFLFLISNAIFVLFSFSFKFAVDTYFKLKGQAIWNIASGKQKVGAS